MTCDAATQPGAGYPGRFSLFGTDQYATTDRDRGPMLTERQTAAVAAGCVFLRCDESGAFDCAEGFRCDTALAEPTSIGCIGIPCAELGTCSGAAYVCEPTSTERRPPAVDAHGCVTKNCEEGAPCPESTTCDFTKEGDAMGCAVIRCDDPGGSCPRENTKCDPAPALLPSGLVPVPDAFGCVPEHCEVDGAACTEGTQCAPENPRGDARGCVAPEPPEPPDAGASGAGGAAGGAGGAFNTGGTVPGGSTSGDTTTSGAGGGPTGVCG
jgi:hypothetical protein